MPLYEVLVERVSRHRLLVDSTDPHQAKAEALALADGFLYPDEEDGPVAHIVLLNRPHPGDEVWVGGEGGNWVPSDEYDKGVRS